MPKNQDGYHVDLKNVEETLKNTEMFLESEERALEDALKYLLKQMYLHAKLAGNYKDMSGALRASLSVNVETMEIYETKEEAIAKMSMNAEPKIEVEGDGYWGAISAGMWYAAIVETKQGFNVLQGTIDKFEPLANKYLAHKMGAEKVEKQAMKSIAWFKSQK